MKKILEPVSKMVLLGLCASVFALDPSPYNLVTQDEKPWRLSDQKDSYVLLSFVFTRCPMANMCPLTMKLNKRVLNLWKKDSKLPRNFQVVAVTLDPDHDKPAVLKSYLKTHGLSDEKNFVFLTHHDAKLLESLASEFNVIAYPSGGTLAHSVKTVLLAPGLKPIQSFKDNEWKPEEVAEAIKKNK